MTAGRALTLSTVTSNSGRARRPAREQERLGPAPAIHRFQAGKPRSFGPATPLPTKATSSTSISVVMPPPPAPT